jgi:Flp pilus assembly protein TadG
VSIRGPAGRQRDERGSLTVFTVVWAITILLLAALAIDGGLAISQRERAADIADQAARTDAEGLALQPLRDSGQVQIQDDECALARAYVAKAAEDIHDGTAYVDDDFGGHDGCDYFTETVPSADGQPGAAEVTAVTVEVHLTYSPFVFDLFTGPLMVTETGTAFAQAGD